MDWTAILKRVDQMIAMPLGPREAKEALEDLALAITERIDALKDDINNGRG